uniref:Uncharacterized protein n=1 Tax=Anopheles minimus TaxID=112268 RepID=A0A182WNU8_9DIPT
MHSYRVVLSCLLPTVNLAVRAFPAMCD